jgi:hypothetical protein
MKSDRFINSGIYSTRIGLSFLLTSLLLLAVSTVPEIGTVEAWMLEKVFLYFTFLLAPLFHLFGVGLAIANFFAPRGTKKGYAVCGFLLNGLGLLFAALGWILFLFLFILVHSGADFVGPWR